MSGKEERRLQETARLIELSHVEKPWDQTGMDILGPFSLSKKVNRYIVVAMEVGGGRGLAAGRSNGGSGLLLSRDTALA